MRGLYRDLDVPLTPLGALMGLVLVVCFYNGKAYKNYLTEKSIAGTSYAKDLVGDSLNFEVE